MLVCLLVTYTMTIILAGLHAINEIDLTIALPSFMFLCVGPLTAIWKRNRVALALNFMLIEAFVLVLEVFICCFVTWVRSK